MRVSRDDIIEYWWRYFPIIEVSMVKAIPRDYPGMMGVPITYMDKHNDRFAIEGVVEPVINGKAIYKRIVIRNLRPDIPKTVDIDRLLSKAYGRNIRAENIIGIAAGGEYKNLIGQLEVKYGWYGWWKIINGYRNRVV